MSLKLNGISQGIQKAKMWFVMVPVTVTFDPTTQLICESNWTLVPNLKEFPEGVAGDIVFIRQQQRFVRSQQPWPLTHEHQNLIISSLSPYE